MNVKGVPWDVKGEGNEGAITPRRKEETEDVPMQIDSDTPEVRRSKITVEMMKRHGTTEGCQGCRAHQRGRRSGVHSQMCRERFEQMEKERGKRMQEEFEERQHKRDQRESERKEQEEKNRATQDESRKRARERAEERNRIGEMDDEMTLAEMISLSLIHI